jgi:16S rRNA (adenine1518-N6/adenine1519-N6)-dimethyltransferase
LSATPPVRLLGAGDVRAIASRLGVHPTKRLGQNFVVEPGTVRQIAALAGPFARDDVILEVGPGLGSLTLALLEAALAGGDTGGATGSAEDRAMPEADDRAGSAGTGLAGASPEGATRIVAVEIDPVLAAELPKTIADRAPGFAGRVIVTQGDALALTPALAATAGPPTVLAANLPYNVAVPVVLHLLAGFPSIERGVVMVQAEVADRMCARPGSRVYGVPSAKLAWYARARPAGVVPRSVFWPVPNVDSKLVAFARHQDRGSAGAAGGAVEGAEGGGPAAARREVFAVIDAAFGQRRKTLRAALAAWAGSAAEAERILCAAGVSPGARGEGLGIAEFARIAAARARGENGTIH